VFSVVLELAITAVCEKTHKPIFKYSKNTMCNKGYFFIFYGKETGVKMAYLARKDRFQTQFTSLEEPIDHHTNLRGLPKVNGEMVLIMTVYNLKRVINILGVEELIQRLKTWKPKYPVSLLFIKKRLVLNPYPEPGNQTFIIAA
jgi:hypothetical protein